MRDRPESITRDAPGAGFRKLAYCSIALTFALVVVGGIVRVSDSGLGCGPGGSGTQGWPLCGGRVIPLVDTNMIIEYTHRLLAGSLTVVIAALAVLSWRRHREHRALVRFSVAALALVVFQAALGGLTVEKGLKEELVAAHLGIAMLQLSLLMVVAYLARGVGSRSTSARFAPASGVSFPPVKAGVRVLAVGATIAVLGTIVAGGYMSANELHGTGKSEPSVHTACGNDFPSCGGEFLPFGKSRELDIHLTHRAFMYLASALVFALFLAVLWQERNGGTRSGGRRLTKASGAAVAILATQVTLGALNVWLGEHAWLVIAHLAVATLLWSSLVYVSMLVHRAPRRAKLTSPREAKVEAAPA